MGNACRPLVVELRDMPLQEAIMRTFWTVTVGLFVLAGPVALCEETPAKAVSFESLAKAALASKDVVIPYEKVRGLPFDEQMQLSNLITLRRQIDDPLGRLDEAEVRLEMHRSQTLPERIDLGSREEAGIVAAVEDLIKFAAEHDQRINGWVAAGQDVHGAAAFWDAYRMSPGLVKTIKDGAYPREWKFAAVHWYPTAVAKGLDLLRITHDALGLTEERWLSNDAELRLYAFFSFYRKNAAGAPAALAVWLKGQTGYADDGGLWAAAQANPVRAVFRRWTRDDYYTYEFAPRAGLRVFGDRSLPADIAFMAAFDGGREAAGSLGVFYDKKIILLHALVAEMLAATDAGRSVQPYWTLYSFVCRSFPCVSAFRMIPGHDDCWHLVEGYDGDRPMEGAFAEGSVMGLCLRLLKSEPLCRSEPDLVTKVLAPVVLLPQRDLDPRSAEPARSFVDPKVGFEGYLLAARRMGLRAAAEGADGAQGGQR
jgi:hypothetical protein